MKPEIEAKLKYILTDYRSYERATNDAIQAIGGLLTQVRNEAIEEAKNIIKNKTKTRTESVKAIEALKEGGK